MNEATVDDRYPAFVGWMAKTVRTSHMTDKISEIVQLFSEHAGPCRVCGLNDFSTGDSERWLQAQVNHYLKKHGATLLHVGQQTMRGEFEDAPWQHTTAVIGLKKP